MNMINNEHIFSFLLFVFYIVFGTPCLQGNSGMDWKCCSSSERVGSFIFQPSFFPISVDRIGLAVCFRSQFSPCPSSLSLDITFFHLFFQIQRILKQGNSSDTKSTSPLALTTSLQLAECNTALDCQRKPSHLKTQGNMPL